MSDIESDLIVYDSDGEEINEEKEATQNDKWSVKLGRIYKISCDETEYVYIGSTDKPLKERLEQHKRDYKKWKNNKFNYISSFEIVKYSSAKIELVDVVLYRTRDELLNTERIYMLAFSPVANQRMPTRTKEEKRVYQKKYREENKEHIKTLMESYKNMSEKCECGEIVPYFSVWYHQKSKKHMKKMKIIMELE